MNVVDCAVCDNRIFARIGFVFGVDDYNVNLHLQGRWEKLRGRVVKRDTKD